MRFEFCLLFIFSLFFINPVHAAEKKFDVNVVVVAGNESIAEDNILRLDATTDNASNQEGTLNTVIRNEEINAFRLKGVSELTNMRLDNSLFFPIVLVVLLVLIIAAYFFRKKRRKKLGR